MAEWLLYEHDDGRHAVAPSAEAATFAKGEPAWHRVGPVEVPATGLSRAAEIVQAEIERAEALLHVEEGGAPVFDLEQTEAGICALRTVLAAIQSEATEAPSTNCPACNGYGRINDGSGARSPYGLKCRTCGGSGRVPSGVGGTPR